MSDATSLPPANCGERLLPILVDELAVPMQLVCSYPFPTPHASSMVLTISLLGVLLALSTVARGG